jgi:RimJ/RimL family protein N-acetyltransferase
VRVCQFRHFGFFVPIHTQVYRKHKTGSRKVTFSYTGDIIALRAFVQADLAALERYLNHPDLAGRRYIPWGFPQTAPLSTAQIEKILLKWQEVERGLRLAVVWPKEQAVIGHLSLDWGWDPLSPDIGVVISPEYQRRGCGSEALQMGLRYLFEETPAHSVGSTWVADDNQPALAFMEKHGFQMGGQARWVGMNSGQPFNMLAGDILKSEWLAKGGAHAAGG